MKSHRREPTLMAMILFAWVATPPSLTRADDKVAGANSVFPVVAGQRQLFLDNHGIHTIENLRRTMHRPQKRGAVIRSPISSQTIQTRTAPVWDPDAKMYKLWVLGIDQTFWQSPDGLHWSPGPKPNLKIDMAVYDSRESDPGRRF